jgi:hypothetical protein
MIRSRARSRLAAVVLSSLAVAGGGAVIAGCGSDNEGPAEEAGKVIDTVGKEATQAVKKGAHEVDKNVDVNVDTGDDNGGKNKGSDDHQKDDKGKR